VRQDASGIGTLLLVACAVVVGHAERRPMNATKISLYVDLPRTTVLRKLEQLIEHGVVVKHGLNYCIAPERAARSSPNYIQRQTRILKSALLELAPKA
jgi:DNA-binding IclR family transcriptional regulator